MNDGFIPALLIEASAGTGKTQALGQRLIELLRRGVAPEEIVALTFSRAAAGEIFERFVTLLAAEAVKSPDDARLLRRVIATQHLSQIGTLDSFLLRIVRAFPLELGITGDLTLMDDHEVDVERAKLSFSILRRTDARLKKSFVDAFSLALNHEDVRSYIDSYRDFITHWHDSVAALPDPSAWGDPLQIWGCDPAFAKVTERELAYAADRVEAAFPADAHFLDFAKWVRDFRGVWGKPTGFAKKFFGETDVFAGDICSFKFGRKQFTLSREETLIVREAVTAVCGYVVRTKLELARGIYRLISAFETEYAKKVRSTGRLVFADIPRLLARLPEDRRLSLEFRMDMRIRAWALDEFQDTSREQWRALSNLIDEAKQSGGEKSLFVVGDSKQAIYGWRDGDVTIFARERDSGFYTVKSRDLTYRSGPAVVESVNRVFARGRIFDEFPAWRCPEHHTAHPEYAGFVRTIEASGRGMDAFVEPVFTALVATLGERADDPRRRGVSAAILVRGNKFGAFLTDQLKALGIEGVVWEGERSISDTPALSGFLDLFQLADHPGDAMTYRHFCLTPLASAKYPQGIPDAGEISREIAHAFSTRGIVRTLRELRAVLPEDPSVAWSVFTEERFTDMLRAAGEFETGLKAGTCFSDFPDFLAGQKRRTVAETGRIKIMTIHRSKGLGFDYVVLPLYETNSLSSEPTGSLIGDNWILPDPTAHVSRVVGGLETAAGLRKDRYEQEALCMFYVAMTRAKHAMTIILRPAGSALYFSDLVRSAELGDLECLETRLAPVEPEKGVSANQSARVLTKPTVRGRRVELHRRLPSLIFQSGMSAGLLFTHAASREAARSRGAAAHAEMEGIEFSTELPKPEGFVELWREKAFEVYVDGEWISGRFDRVVFFRTAAGLSAEIVDFKSSLRHPEHYAGQLEAYCCAVHALTGIPRERISAKLKKI